MALVRVRVYVQKGATLKEAYDIDKSASPMRILFVVP